MASISAPGFGSGLDINSLVEQLVAAERAPVTQRLDFREATYQTQISAYGTLKSALSSFSSALVLQSQQSTFQKATVTSSDTDILTATANSKAADGEYSIIVNNLATAHSLASTGFASSSDVVGTGTLTFKFGDTNFTGGPDDPVNPEDPFVYTGFTANADKATQTVTIDSTNNTLAGIRDAVNDANIGVSASIINNGTTSQLVFSSKDSGENNSLEITVDDTTDGDVSDTDTNGLSQLAFQSGAVNLSQTVAAKDANVTINGITVNNSANKFSDAISGVTLDLKKADAAVTVKLTVAKDSNTVSNVVRNFVQDYNDLLSTVNDISRYNAETQQASILTGDSTVRSITSQLRLVLNDTITGLTGPFTSLAEIGVETERDGTLSINSVKLDAALDRNPNAIAFLFAAGGQTTSSKVDFVTSGDNTQPGEYAINITQAATQGNFNGVDFGYDGGTPITIDDTNKELSFTVDGINSGTITLTKTDYTGAALAVELQSRINGSTALSDGGVSVSVSFDDTDANNEHFVITSTRYGDASSVSGASSSGNNFGLTGGTSTVGVNVAGTIGGQVGSGSGRILTGSSTVSGLKVEILDDSLGDHGNISFTRGVADRMHTFIGKYLGTDSVLEGKIDSAEASVDRINTDRKNLDLRLTAIEDRIRSQFIAMDLLVAQLNTTSTFLTQQLANLPEIKVRSSNR